MPGLTSEKGEKWLLFWGAFFASSVARGVLFLSGKKKYQKESSGLNSFTEFKARRGPVLGARGSIV